MSEDPFFTCSILVFCSSFIVFPFIPLSALQHSRGVRSPLRALYHVLKRIGLWFGPLVPGGVSDNLNALQRHTALHKHSTSVCVLLFCEDCRRQSVSACRQCRCLGQTITYLNTASLRQLNLSSLQVLRLSSSINTPIAH